MHPFLKIMGINLLLLSLLAVAMAIDLDFSSLTPGERGIIGLEFAGAGLVLAALNLFASMFTKTYRGALKGAAAMMVGIGLLICFAMMT